MNKTEIKLKALKATVEIRNEIPETEDDMQKVLNAFLNTLDKICIEHGAELDIFVGTDADADAAGNDCIAVALIDRMLAKDIYSEVALFLSEVTDASTNTSFTAVKVGITQSRGTYTDMQNSR